MHPPFTIDLNGSGIECNGLFQSYLARNMFAGNSITCFKSTAAVSNFALELNQFETSNASGVQWFSGAVIDARNNWWGDASGPAFMLKMCEYGLLESYNHFLYGGKPKVNQRLENNLKEQYHGINIAGIFNPLFRELTRKEDRAIIEMINKTKPGIVWVGLGAPKQEKWILRNLKGINAPVLIGVGAAFDFHFGEIPWAPGWIRYIGMEWTFRLIIEPLRMFRRNIDSLVY